MTNLSPAAQAVRRDLSQIMHELSQRCRVSISATDTLPITLETNDASLQAGLDSLCAAVLRAAADQVAPVRAWHESDNDAAWERHQMSVIINRRILRIAAELEGHEA